MLAYSWVQSACVGSLGILYSVYLQYDEIFVIIVFLCDWLESKLKSAKVAVYPPRLALISCETLWCLWQTPVCVSSSVTLVTVAFSQEQMSLGAAHLNGIQMTRTKSVDLCWWCETTWGYPGWGHMWFFFFLKWSAINNNLMIFLAKLPKEEWNGPRGLH